MRLLLDTHYLIWLANATEQLRPAEQALLGDPEVRPIISSVTFWELRIKWNGRRPAAREALLDPHEAIAFAQAQGFELAELSPIDCATSLDDPIRHRDPFDEQLLIHAQRLGARLLTRDRLLTDHPLAYRIA